MSFNNWLQNLRSALAPSRGQRNHRRRGSLRAATHRPNLEVLEDRCVPSFSPAVSYPTGNIPTAVLTADFNGDGRLDLAVTTSSLTNLSSTVSILLGNGDGTFQPAQNFATGTNPLSLAVGDFNKDGKLDLATANIDSYDVSVLLGNGDGTFQAPRSIGLGSRPQSVAVGDFNGDGKLDLGVTSNLQVGGAYYSSFYSFGCANVLLGNGDGTFAAPNVTALGAGYHGSAAVADFNGDAKLDFATVNGDYGTVRVLLGNGSGVLGAPTDFINAGGSLVAGDVNGDGHTDLVTNVSVLLGDGAGGFAAAQNYAAGANPSSVVVADFNRDGKPDLVTANQGSSPGYAGSVSVLLGNGDGTFSSPVNSTAGSYPSAVAAGDFNGDGWLDAVTANRFGSNVSVLINDTIWGSLAVSGFPAATMAGTAGSFTVTARNADATTATNYTGTVHFTSSDLQAVLPADYTFTTADAGVYTFSAMLKTAGTQSITAKDTFYASLIGSETGITVTPAAASHLGVGAPATGIAGNPFNVILTALDPYNNTATSYTGTIHFTSSDPKAALLADYTFTAADNGMHTFSNGVTLKTAGGQTVTATDTVTSSIAGSAAVTVSPAAAGALIFAGFPSTTTAGVAGNVTVTLKDPYGNLASGYTGTVHFSSSDGKAALPANYTFTTADAGLHTFSATLKTAGTQSITVQDTVTAGLSGTAGGITVNPAAASQFIISAPSSVSAGVPFSLTVKVQDAYGNVVTGYTGTIRFSSTDSSATLPASYTFTAADKGVHTFSGIVLRKRGTQKITLTDTLNSSLTGRVIENVL